MTTITYDIQDNHFNLFLKGHAGYCPGNDVVCAGVSTLTYTFINFLENAIEDGKIENLYIDDTPGDMHIEYDNISLVKDITDLILTGYEMISDEFPDNVSIGGTHCF